MSYDGFLVVFEGADESVGMLFFRSPTQAGDWIKSHPTRIGGFRPSVRGFRFADLPSIGLVQ